MAPGIPKLLATSLAKNALSPATKAKWISILAGLLIVAVVFGVPFAIAASATVNSQDAGAAVKAGQLGMSVDAVQRDGASADDVARFSAIGASNNVPWEIVAAISTVQKEDGNTWGIEPDRAKAEGIDVTDADSAGQWLAKKLANELTKIEGPQNKDLNAGAVPDVDKSGNWSQLEPKPGGGSDRLVRAADEVKNYYRQAIEKLPLIGNPNRANEIYDTARRYALAQSNECKVDPGVFLPGSGAWSNPLIGPAADGVGNGVYSPFGYRGWDGYSNIHYGADISPPMGTLIRAASDGVVIEAPDNGGRANDWEYNNAILVKVSDSITLWYLHSIVGSVKVKKGDTIVAGQPLSLVGATGNVTGPHLHFQVMVNGVATDPEAFMKERGVILGVDPPLNSEPSKSGNPETTPPEENNTPPSDGSKDVPDVPDGLTVVGPNGSGELTLNKKQVTYASQIIGTAQKITSKMTADNQAILALMVVLQESSLRMYANPRVPDSYNYPYDAEASDHESVGLYQQQPWWGATKDLMDPVASTRIFFGGPDSGFQPQPPGVLDLPGYENRSLGSLAQDVQVSAYPDAYLKWEPTARELVAKVTGTTPDVGSTCGGAGNQGDKADNDTEQNRNTLVEKAKSGLGGPETYRASGTDFKAWDNTGYVNWVYQQIGVTTPRDNIWGAGARTDSPKPGDLVALNPRAWADNGEATSWELVGVYVGTEGGNRMIATATPQQGTAMSIAPQDATFFTLLGQPEKSSE